MLLDLDTLYDINSKSVQSQDDITRIKNLLSNELLDINNNIKSSSLVNANNEFKEQFTNILSKISSNLLVLNNFYKNQLNDYQVLMTNAIEKINQLVVNINSNIDKKGKLTTNSESFGIIYSSIGSIGLAGETINTDKLLNLYDGGLVKIKNNETLGDYLYEELNLSEQGYENGEQFLDDVISTAKECTVTNRGKTVKSAAAYLEIAATYGRKPDYNYGGGHGTVKIVSNSLSEGLDCSSFVSWAVQQGATKDFVTQTTYGLINAGQSVSYADAGSILPGDIAVSTSHAMLILENKVNSNQMVIAEAAGSAEGVIVRTISYNDLQNGGYSLRDLSEYYK